MSFTNMHIHSCYSWDSKMTLSRIFHVLRSNHVSYGAIVDHVELDREPIHEVLEKLKIRNFKIDRLNERFHNVVLLKGIEVSEPYLYPREMEILENFELDYILGSVHHMMTSAKTYEQQKAVFREYYENILKMVEFGYIDAVGHLDYLRRYYLGLDYGEDSQVYEVLSAIVSNHLLLEINTSAKRRTETRFFPGVLKLKYYASIGGENIVIGTDAHRESELVDNIEPAISVAKELRLHIGIFKNRKFERI